jgi:GDP-mannose transporter
MIWDQHAAPAGIMSLFLCLVGGSFYQQAPLRKTHQKPTRDDVVPQDGTWNTDDLSIGESSAQDEEVELLLGGSQNSEEVKKRKAMC